MIDRHVSFFHETTGNRADLRNLEDLQHLGAAFFLLFVFRLEHADHRLLDIFEKSVDHLVAADFNAHFFRGVACRGGHVDIESEDNRFRGIGELDIGLGNSAHARVQDLDGDLVALDSVKRLNDRFDRALNVAFDDQVQREDVVFGHLFGQVVQRQMLFADNLANLAARHAALRDVPRFRFRGHDDELLACFRAAAQAENLHRRCGTRRFHILATFIAHGAHAAILGAADEVIADLQRAFLNQDRGQGAAVGINVGLDHGAKGVTRGVGAQFQHVRLKRDILEQVIDTTPRNGGNGHHDGVAAVFLGNQLVAHEILLHTVGVSPLDVGLVEGDKNGDARCLGVVDRLHRLGHDAVIRRHHQNHQVGDGGSAGTHFRESFVARSVQKDDVALLRLHVVGADMLGDTAIFRRGDIRLANPVEQRGLSVVDVAHDGDNRRTRGQLHVLLFDLHVFLHISFVGFANQFDFDFKLQCQLFGEVWLHQGIHGEHLAHLNELLHDLVHADAGFLCELADGEVTHKLNDLRRLGFLRAVARVAPSVRSFSFAGAFATAIVLFDIEDLAGAETPTAVRGGRPLAAGTRIARFFPLLGLFLGGTRAALAFVIVGNGGFEPLFQESSHAFARRGLLLFLLGRLLRPGCGPLVLGPGSGLLLCGYRFLLLCLWGGRSGRFRGGGSRGSGSLFAAAFGFLALTGHFGLAARNFHLRRLAGSFFALLAFFLFLLALHLFRGAAAFRFFALAAVLESLLFLQLFLLAAVEVRKNMADKCLVEGTGRGKLLGYLMSLGDKFIAMVFHLRDNIFLVDTKKLCYLLNLHRNSVVTYRRLAKGFAGSPNIISKSPA